MISSRSSSSTSILYSTKPSSHIIGRRPIQPCNSSPDRHRAWFTPLTDNRGHKVIVIGPGYQKVYVLIQGPGCVSFDVSLQASQIALEMMKHEKKHHGARRLGAGQFCWTKPGGAARQAQTLRQDLLAGPEHQHP